MPGGIHVTLDMFVDRPHVVRRWQAKRLAVLSRGGAYARGVMQKLQRRVRMNAAPSKEGDAPKARTGLIRDFTFFGIADDEETAVIGPLPLTVPREIVLHGKVSIPQLLNEGGRETVLHGRHAGTYRYGPRPFGELTANIAFPWFKRLLEKTPL